MLSYVEYKFAITYEFDARKCRNAKAKIYIIINTVIDALNETIKEEYEHEV
ncbi:hypothetical protein CMALT394_210043 [Carnobacterium maltaromaticum]|nr:hypothetical protein CMALT394_210043 [Carnobacterium maltaromaticum]